MSLDKLIAAATDYFSTGAEVHRRALAGGGGKITDLSEPKVGTAIDTVAAKPKAEKPKAEKPVAAQPVAAQPPAAAAAQVPVPDAVTDVVAKPAVVEDDLDGGSDGEVLDYEADIRPVLRAKTLTNREGLIALLGTFGVKSGAELTATQYPAFFAGLKAL